MSSGAKSNIAIGTPGTQLGISQLTSEQRAIDNESRVAGEIKKEIATDFFVGPNGKALPAKLQKWIGTNRRNSLMKKAKNVELRKAIAQLYRKGAFIGDGGTASVIVFEKISGISLGRNGNSHVQKGKDMLRFLEKNVLANPDISIADRKLASKLAKSLKRALER